MARDEKNIEIPGFDLSGFSDVLLAQDTDPAAYFPRDQGKSPYGHQREALEDARDFFAATGERIKMDHISTAGGKTILAYCYAMGWLTGKPVTLGQKGRKSGGGVAVHDSATPPVAEAAAHGTRAIIICTNKELQSQYVRAMGPKLSVVMGAGEFTCTSSKGSCGSRAARRTCEARRLPKDEDGNVVAPLGGAAACACPYRAQQFGAKEEASAKPFCFTPHSYLAYRQSKAFSETLEQGNMLMVVDEAHLLPDILRDQVTISVREDFLTQLLAHSGRDGDDFRSLFFGTRVRRNHESLPLTQMGDQQSQYLEVLGQAVDLWTENCLGVMRGSTDKGELAAAFPGVRFNSEDDVMRFMDLLGGLRDKVTVVLESRTESRWACELTSSASPDGSEEGIWGRSAHVRLLIRPDVIPLSFIRRFFRGCSKVILMSATLWKNHLERLGLVDPAMITEEGKVLGVREFEAESRIEPKRRRMHIDLAHGMAVNNRNLKEAFTKFNRIILDQVTSKLPGQKGLIHVSSAAQATLFAEIGNQMAKEQLASGEGHRGGLRARFITTGEDGWRDTYAKFCATPPDPAGTNLFLVAAGRYEGLDLSDSLCRILIFAKVPYLNIKDSLTVSLDHIYKVYSSTVAMTRFIQGANRAARHPKDWCLGICFDTNAEKLFGPHLEQMKGYVREQLEFVTDPDWLKDWRSP